MPNRRRPGWIRRRPGCWLGLGSMALWLAHRGSRTARVRTHRLLGVTEFETLYWTRLDTHRAWSKAMPEGMK